MNYQEPEVLVTIFYQNHKKEAQISVFDFKLGGPLTQSNIEFFCEVNCHKKNYYY